MRNVMLGLLVLVCVGLAGCGSGGDKPTAAGAAGAAGGKAVSAADARKELMDTAEKMEGAFAVAVESYVTQLEEGNWSWSMLDNEFRPGKRTPETIAAYKKWRAVKIAEDKNKKK